MFSLLALKNAEVAIDNPATQDNDVKPLSIEELDMVGGGEAVVNAI